MATWQKRYEKGNFVEVLELNKWILGYVLNRRDRGTPEYDIQLMTDGSVVTHTLKMMREGTLDLGEEVMNPVNMPAPQPPPAKGKRFGKVQEKALTDMEMAAKAFNTHKQTAWGIKIFKGKLYFQ